MSFPRAPNRKVKGGLRLTIRAPLSVETEREAPKPDPSAVDYAKEIKIKSPLGFSLDGDIKDSFSRQKNNALLRLSELRKKSLECNNCKNFIQEETIDMAEALVDHLCDYYKDKITNLTAILVGHYAIRKGIITVEFTCGNKFFKSSVEDGAIACYSSDSPVPVIVENPRSETLLHYLEGLV